MNSSVRPICKNGMRRQVIVMYSLTAKELKYIPKIILLLEFKNYIDQLWDRLPEHIKANSKINNIVGA